MNKEKVLKHIKSLSNQSIAKHSQRFFKTKKGEYGYGDSFLGVRVPELRKLVTYYKKLPLNQLEYLLSSKYHEVRLFSILSLVKRFQNNKSTQERIYKIYLNNTQYINNWDLVDSSAHHIVGAYLLNKDKAILYKLSQSTSLWERRISIISTFFYIKLNQCSETMIIAKRLLNDKEDLIHKAVGWMLREVGKQNINLLIDFLKQHYQNIPRTMLRYAIEKFDNELRIKYLRGEF